MGLLLKSVIFLISIFFIQTSEAFIFDEVDDSIEKTQNVMNYNKYTTCLKNDTIANYVNTFRAAYNDIKDINDDDLMYFKYCDYSESILDMCNKKRDKARRVTDYIHHIAAECVNENMRKRFILNTLLMLEFQLDFICSINESVFTTIYKNHVVYCINNHMDMLNQCRENSFNLLFFDRVPSKVSWISLLNGGICNFNYESMKRCSEDPLNSCEGAKEALSYLLDVIKRNSICFKRKNVSDIIESAKDGK